MLLGLEIGMLVVGFIALIRGKITLSRGHSLRGVAVRLAGVALLLPIPVAFAAGFVYAAYLAASGEKLNEQDIKLRAGLIELGCTLAFLVLGIVIAAAGGTRYGPEEDRPRRRRDYDLDEDLPRRRRRAAEEPSEALQAEPRPRREPVRIEDGEDDEDRPRRRAGGTAPRRPSRGAPAGLIVAAVAGGVILLGSACAGVGFLIWRAGRQPEPAPAVAQKAAVGKGQAAEVPDIARDPAPPQWPAPAPEAPPPAAPRDDGHALAPVRIAPPRRADIRPPALDGDRAEVVLAAPVADVAVGGDGRFLVLHLPQRQQLVIFDANKAAIAKSLPAADNIKFAAAWTSSLWCGATAPSSAGAWPPSSARQQVS
jgi:hypothetical protein